MQPHLGRRNMAGIDRRPARRQHRKERRLRPFEVKGDLVVAVCLHLGEVVVPGFARVDAQLLLRRALQQIEGAFDVLGSKRFAVVPFDAVPQGQRQLGAILAPGPAGGELRYDRIGAVLLDILLVDDQVVKYAHHRPVHGGRRFFEKRHARWAVEMPDPERAARLLGGRPVRYAQRDQQRCCRCQGSQTPFHHLSSRVYCGAARWRDRVCSAQRRGHFRLADAAGIRLTRAGCRHAPTAAGSGTAAAASGLIAEARNPIGPSNSLDRSARIARRDRVSGAGDEIHPGRRECVEPSRHCRLDRCAHAGDPTSAAFPVPGVVRGRPRLATPHQ